MSITNLDNKEAYTYFIESISKRLEAIEISLIETRGKLNYITDQILYVGKSFGLRNDLYTQIVNYNKTGILPTLEYLESIDFRETRGVDWFIYKNPVVNHYFISFVKLSIEVYRLIELKSIYLNCNIDYKTYYRLFTSFYNSVANKLLSGKDHIIYTVGDIAVLVKKNTVSKGTKFKVDWGASYKLLKEYAKTNHPEIYSDYINGMLNKKAFIEALSPYTYNEKENPSGFKWLIHLHKDRSAWLTFYKKKINPDYNIIPSNFIMNETRSQSDFLTTVKSVDDILNSNQLGFRDKLNCLIKFDDNYIHKFCKV